MGKMAATASAPHINFLFISDLHKAAAVTALSENLRICGYYARMEAGKCLAAAVIALYPAARHIIPDGFDSDGQCGL
jgi:hypothetical protein